MVKRVGDRHGCRRKQHAVHLGQPLFRQRLANVHALRRKGFSTRTASLVDLQGIDVMLVRSLENKRQRGLHLFDASSSVSHLYDHLRILRPNRLRKRGKVLSRLVQRIDSGTRRRFKVLPATVCPQLGSYPDVGIRIAIRLAVSG